MLNKMFEAQLHQDAFFWKNNTYVAKIAFLLQAAPDKMLTFTQLRYLITTLTGDNRITVRGNINVCLNIHPCFVKIPVDPSVVRSLVLKKYVWTLDTSQVTMKVLRRHFIGILHLFPELASKVETEERNGSSEADSAPRHPEPATCKAVQIRRDAKFSGPFSIESLLKRDSPCDRPSRPSPLSSVPVRVEQQPRLTHGQVRTKRRLSWDKEEAGSSPICSAAKTMKRMHVCTEPSYPIFTKPAPHFTYPHGIYIVYPGPAFT
ncbi:uncharacterized protein LOC131447267 [Solea solea]|uniref:uncharacterized protein LOC131447267 n=1 Tax=Solea solea TaxID=90069 RepID=UPI00272A9983|nr:uncharacterized protein LOC131447267 [Solea solea]XP_058474902.1 uncharacterized protein LOC131447267 [Solea solea]